VNLIGESVLYIASFLRIHVSDIFCIVEDSDLALGEMRVDYVYSNLKHEGVDSMIKALKSDKFAKIRVGIGKPPEGMSMTKYLLQDFTFAENMILIDVLNKTEKVARMLINHPVHEVQEKFNPEGAPKIKKRQIKKIHIDHKKLKK
jgi:PTH1 family peptidyl-tRNA hydrolase